MAKVSAFQGGGWILHGVFFRTDTYLVLTPLFRCILMFLAHGCLIRILCGSTPFGLHSIYRSPQQHPSEYFNYNWGGGGGGENSPKVTRGRVYSVCHIRLFHPIRKKSYMKPCLPCSCGRYVKGFGSLSSWSEGLLSATDT